jgi:hypothetical protein
MSVMNEREQRRPVRLSVRFKTDNGWGDAQIRNISTGGMMAVCERPPRRGTYVEFRRGDSIIIGRVMWTCDDRFGLKSQDKINLQSLTASISQAANDSEERRTRDRAREQLSVSRQSAEEMAARSAILSRAFQFITIAVIAGAAVMILADSAYDTISRPLESAESILAKSGR